MKKIAMIQRTGALLLLVLFLGQSAAFAQFQDIERKIEEEKYTQALDMIAVKLGEDPRNERLDYLKGKVFFLLERYPEASASFLKGQSHGARYPWNFIGTASVQVKNDDFPGAKLSIDRAVEMNKKKDTKIMNGIARAWLGVDPNSAIKQNFLDQAEIRLNRVLLIDGNNLEALIGLGDLYDRLNVDELALGNYEKAVQIDPKFIKGWLRVGQIKKKMKKYTEAAAAFKKAIEIDPNFPPPHKEMGEMWFGAKEYDKAVSSFKTFLDLVDNDISARIRYATSLFLAEKYAEAEPEMKAILDDTLALVTLRLYPYTLVELEKTDLASTAIEKYFSTVKPISIIPGDHHCRADIHQLNAEDSLAVEDLLAGIARGTETNSPKPEYYKEIAAIYKKAKNFSQQAFYTETYLKESGKEPGIRDLFDLGRAYHSDSSFVKADSIFVLMAAKNPDIPLAHSWRARNAAAQDPKSDLGLAKPHYEKVLEVIGEDADKQTKFKRDYKRALSYLGSYYTLVTKEYEPALEYWEKILAFDPENKGANDAKDYIEKMKNR